MAYQEKLRFWAAVTVLVASIVDLTLTQHLLDDGHQEANPVMASIVSTNWAWAPKAGFPALLVLGCLHAPTSRWSVVAVTLVAVGYLGVLAYGTTALVA